MACSILSCVNYVDKIPCKLHKLAKAAVAEHGNTLDSLLLTSSARFKTIAKQAEKDMAVSISVSMLYYLGIPCLTQ